MSLKNKIILIIVILFTCLMLGDIVKLKYELNKSNKNLISFHQEADLKIGRADTVIADSKNTIDLLNKQIQDDIKSKKSIVDMYADLQARYSATGKGTITIPGPTKEIYTTYYNDKPVQLTSLPFEFHDFRLDANGDAITKTFHYSLTQNFEVQVAQTKLKNGAFNHYAELYELDSGGKRINQLQITKFNVIKSSDIIPASFKWFDLHIDLELAYIVSKDLSNGFSGDLGLSFMSYGTPMNPSWRFARIFTGLNKQGVVIGITPFQYNIGDPLPIFNNLWLGPNIGRNLDTSSYFIGFGISAML